MFCRYDDCANEIIGDVLYGKLDIEIVNPIFSHLSLRRHMCLFDLFGFEKSYKFLYIYQGISEEQICQIMTL